MGNDSKKIGFIGLGIMGAPMAKNLMKAGYSLIAYDIDATRIDSLNEQGADRGTSIADVSRRADILITMVPDSPDVESVVLGSDGIAENAGAGMIVIDMSTISPQVTKHVGKVLAEKGVDLLDAPVSGGITGAEEGTLTILVGGEETVFERCRPIFDVMGKKVTLMGPTGSGQMAKVCNQIIVALNLQAACEGLIVAAKSGLDVRRFLEGAMEGSASSFMLQYVSERVLKGDYTPGFRIRLEQKDLRLCLQTAEELQIPLPGTSLVNQLFRSREAAGKEDEEGNQALMRVYEELAHFALSKL